MANLQINPPPGFFVINEPEKKKDNLPPGFVLVDEKPMGIPQPTVPLPPAGWKPQEQPQEQPQVQQQQQQVQPKPGWGEAIRGAGQKITAIPEAGMAMASGVPSYIAGWLAQAGKSLFDIWRSGGKDVSFIENRKIREQIQRIGTYQPKTPSGQALSQSAGMLFEGLLAPFRLGVNQLTDDPEAREALMLVIEGGLMVALPKIAPKVIGKIKQTIKAGKAMSVTDAAKIINESKEVPLKVKADIQRQIKEIKSTPERPPSMKEIPGQRELRIQRELKKRGIGVRKEGDIRPVSEADISAFQKAGGEVEIGRAPARTAAERQAVMERVATEGIEPGAIKGGGLPYGAELPTKIGNIRIDKLDSTYDIKKVMVEVGDMVASKREMTGKTKKVPWKKTEELAENLGMTVEQLKNNRKGRAFNEVEMERARTMLGGAVRDLQIKQKQHAANPSDMGKLELNAATERAFAIMEVVSDAKTTWGRTGSILRKAYEPGELRFKIIEKAFERAGGRKKNQLMVDELGRIDIDNPLEVMDFIRKFNKAKLSDKFYELWINGLLSGPLTNVKNIVSNDIMLIDKVAMTGVAGLVELPKVLVGKQRNVYLGEVPAGLFGMMRGFPEGVRRGLYAWKNEITMEGVSKLEMRIPRAIGGITGKIIRTPSKFLIGFDELFKGMLFTSDIHMMAYKIATRKGLRGKAKAAEINRLISEPTKQMVSRASGEMLRGTFQNELGSIGKVIQRTRTDMPGFRYIVPFLRVSINIPKAGLRRTPLNLPRIIWLASKGRLKGEALSIEIARAGVGSLTAIAIYKMAVEGNITGAAPTDPAEREAFYAEGKQPYSARIGKKWRSYANIEPLSTIFGISADAAQVREKISEGDNEKIAGALIETITENFTNKTFMRGLTTFMNAVADPRRAGQYFVESLVGSIIPTGVAQAAGAIDPTLRETQSIWDHIKSRIPIVSKELPPKVGRRGEEVKREGSVIERLLNPIWVSTDVTDDIDRELRRLKIFPGRMSKATVREGEKIPPMPYARMLKEAGPRVFTALGSLIRSKGYPNLSDTQKKKLIAGIISTIKGASRFQYRYQDYKK